MKRMTTFIAAAAAIAAFFSPTPVQASGSTVAALAAVPLLQIGGADAAIVRSFRSVVGRAPTERELLRYRTLMVRNGWSEADVRADLGARTDYRKFRNDTSTRPTAAVRSAYQDILGREPDAEGLRNYRQKMAREGWSEQDVRDDLRRSVEYATLTGRTASADRIIRRAYLNVLRREPDADGLETYRREIIENGWEYHDLRQVLLLSEERRANRGTLQGGVRGGVREADAAEMVRRAYRSVLSREADDVGLRDYTAKVVNEGWTEARVVRALRESDEYRAKNR